jgi:hypothetical protein
MDDVSLVRGNATDHSDAAKPSLPTVSRTLADATSPITAPNRRCRRFRARLTAPSFPASDPMARAPRGETRWMEWMEAAVGIEPTYKDLQSSA